MTTQMHATRLQTRVLPLFCPHVLRSQHALRHVPPQNLTSLASALVAATRPCVAYSSYHEAAASATHVTQSSDASALWQHATGQVVSTGTKYVRVNVHPQQPSQLASLQPSSSSSSSHTSAFSSPSTTSTTSSSSTLLMPPKKQLLCTVRALLKKMQQTVLVGDQVTLTAIDWAAGRGVVQDVAPRSSELTDPAVANVGHVVLVFGLTQPPFEAVQVSRFLVSIEATGLPLTLVLNKSDLVPPEEVTQRLQQCAAWGYQAIPISCQTGEGLAQVEARLQGRVGVVAGPSGAGKSSLINALRLGRHRKDSEVPLQLMLQEKAGLQQQCLDEEAEGPPLPTAGSAAAAAEGSEVVMEQQQVAAAGAGGASQQQQQVVDNAASSSSSSEADGCPGSVQHGNIRQSSSSSSSTLHDQQQQGEQHTTAFHQLQSSHTADPPGPGASAGQQLQLDDNHDHHHHQQQQQQQQRQVPAAAAASDAADFLVVGEMSRIGRGMHTTRSVTLVPLPGGGAIADTPGFGLPTLEAVSSRQLGQLFPEFGAAAEAAGRRCRFDDCLHVAEPGCVVLAAGLPRHAYYLKFLSEVKAREELDERALQAAKRQREGNMRSISSKGGKTRYEVRLDTKRYRNVSRRRQKQQLQQEEDEDMLMR